MDGMMASMNSGPEYDDTSTHRQISVSGGITTCDFLTRSAAFGAKSTSTPGIQPESEGRLEYIMESARARQAGELTSVPAFGFGEVQLLGGSGPATRFTAPTMRSAGLPEVSSSLSGFQKA